MADKPHSSFLTSTGRMQPELLPYNVRKAPGLQSVFDLAIKFGKLMKMENSDYPVKPQALNPFLS